MFGGTNRTHSRMIAVRISLTTKINHVRPVYRNSGEVILNKKEGGRALTTFS